MQLTLPLSLNIPHTFDSFIKSAENQQAVDWVRLWPNWPIHQLLIHGEEGSGKTHLAQAFARETGGVIVRGGEAEDLFPDSLISKVRSSGIPLLIIDDYDIIQEEPWLFHVYNMAQEYHLYVLYVGRQAPSQRLFQLPDLQSRLRSLHAIPILSPGDTLFRSLIKKRFNHLGFTCSDDIVEYLFRRLERSYRAINLLVTQVDTFTLKDQRALTLPLLRAFVEISSGEDGIYYE